MPRRAAERNGAPLLGVSARLFGKVLVVARPRLEAGRRGEAVELFRDLYGEAFESSGWMGIGGLWCRALWGAIRDQHASTPRPKRCEQRRGDSAAQRLIQSIKHSREDSMHDLRYAVRTLLKSPGFTVVALISLALGIGVNTTIFSVVNAVLLRPLPVSDPGTLVEVYTATGQEAFPQSVFSYPDYVDLRDNNEVFSGVAAYGLAVASLRHAGDAPKTVVAEVVSANFFDVIGVEPVYGRGFAAEEGVTEGTHPVVVLGHGFWTAQLGADPAIVGRDVFINTTRYTVVGVAPASYTGMLPAMTPHVWLPLMMSDEISIIGIQDLRQSPIGDTRLERRGDRFMFVKARLAPGITIEQAQANASAIMASLEETYPDTNEQRGADLVPVSGVRIFPMIDQVLAPVGWLLLGIVSLVLLIACANVANMLLARSSARRREIAVRLALGASRGALVRQLLTESLLLAFCGGTLGLLLAVWGTNLLSTLEAVSQMSVRFDFGVDGRVFAFAFLASVATGLAFGLLPALRASRPQLVPALKDGDQSGGRAKGIGMRDVLVVAQIAVSLLLLVGAALLGRSLQGAQSIDLGFDADQTALIEMNLDMIGYDEEPADAFQRQYLERIRALPQVEAAALTQDLPLTANVSVTGIFIPGVHESDDDAVVADEAVVGPGYFETMGVRLLEGRDFSEQDTPDTPQVAIVNETMARSYWPGQNVVGQRFKNSIDDEGDYEIVGLVGDHKVRTVGEDPRPYVHFARTQRRSTRATVVARTAGDAADLPALLRSELQAMEPDLASGESTVRESVAVTLLPVTLGAQMLAGFGGLALALAAVGLYGVIAYSVSRRVREIGIRIALGADALGVIRLVVRRGMVMAAVGVLIGGAAAALLSGLLSNFLYGVSALDPMAFGAAAALLMGVAFLANYIPARRAARVDPLTALRAD